MKLSKNPTIPTTLASLIAAGSAHGTVVHMDLTNSFDMGSGGQFRVEWDIDDDGTPDMRFQHYVDTSAQDLRSLFVQDFGGRSIVTSTSSSFTYTFTVTNWNNGPQGFAGGGTNLTGLATGYVVGPTGGFNTNTKVYLVNNYNLQGGLSEGQNYIGFRFLDDGDSGTTLYGWANISIDTNANTFTMTEWAYDDSGAGIEVGAVPEPEATVTGLAALALGAAGLRRWRKSRKSA